MTNTLDKIIREEARLILLKEMAGQANYSLSDVIAQPVLATFGISKTRDWICEELRQLAELGAVTISQAGHLTIATITRKGIDHVEGRTAILNVKRPQPAE